MLGFLGPSKEIHTDTGGSGKARGYLKRSSNEVELTLQKILTNAFKIYTARYQIVPYVTLLPYGLYGDRREAVRMSIRNFIFNKFLILSSPQKIVLGSYLLWHILKICLEANCFLKSLWF